MKKFLSILIVPMLSILLLGIVLPKEIQAAKFEFKEATIEEGDIINENLYIFNDAVDVKGVIRGDLFIFGNNVNVKAAVTGDLYIFGNEVNIEDGTIVDGNFTLFANKATVKGISRENTTAFALTLKISSSTAKDLTVFASSQTLTGNVGDDARVFAGDSIVDANISGELVIFAGESEVNKSKIGKSMYTDEDIEAIANSQGVSFDKEGESKTKVGKGGAFWTRFTSALGGFAGIFIAGTLLIFLAPVKSLGITKKISGSTKEFLASFGVGVGILFLAWIPLLILFVTIIGIPLSLMLFGFLLFGIIFGMVWVNLAIGRGILHITKNPTTSPYLALLIGGVVTMIIKMIPLLSGLYSFVGTATAIGAMTRMKWDKLSTKKEVVAPVV